MAVSIAPLLLNLSVFDEDTDSWTDLGQLTLGADGRLAVAAITFPQAGARIEDFVKLTNDKPGLHMDAEPPPGSPPFAIASRFVARGEPDFLLALQEYADKYYGWTLDAPA